MSEKIENKNKKKQEYRKDKKDNKKYFQIIKEKRSKILKKIKSYFKARLNLQEEKFNLLELGLLIVISFIFGIFVSEALVFQKNFSNNSTKPSIITAATNSNEIETVYNTIINKFYGEVDQKKLKEAAINGMLSYLGDDYSIYFDSKEKTDFEEELNGTYIGVGVKLVKLKEEYPIITEVFENTSAIEEGFKVGDYLIEVEGKDIFDSPLDDVVNNIKGELNKKVNVTIKRGQELLSKKLITKNIDIPSVYSKIYEENGKKIGYLKITIFAQNTDEQFIDKLKELEKSDIDSLIIDVRNNIGGHLTTVTNILNQFFDSNDVIYQREKKGNVTKTYGTGKHKNYNVTVLANNSSASASEILASAFKEISNSDVIGMTTYGKGTVQQTVNLKTGGMVKITTETWLTSKGNQINGIGIAPTIEQELGDEYISNPTEENDLQLQKALEILKDK